MTSYTSSPSVVIFRRDWQIFGGRFQIDITSDDVYVYHLKPKVKDLRHRGNDPRLSHIIQAAPDPVIWKCKDGIPLFDDEDPTNLAHQVRKVFAEERVEQLRASQKLEDVHVSTEDTLLVEVPFVLPGMSCTLYFYYLWLCSHTCLKAYSIGEMVHEFESYYFRVQTKGEVTEEDIELNRIKDVDEAFLHDVPGFVKEHEEILGQKRKVVSDKVRSHYILSTYHADDELRCVQLLNLWLAKTLQRNTLII
jgi:hypothetical protein